MLGYRIRSTRWNIILYQDGVDPSDGLAKCHSRKSNVFYWSFVELGAQALAHEQVWGTVCLTRSTEASKLPGNITQLTTKVLDLFFGQPHDISRAGVVVSIDGSIHGAEAMRARIFARLGVFLADEPALKEMLACKGHAGHKPCLLCMNATLANVQNPLHIRCSDYAVSITETDWDAFAKHTDETIRESLRRINVYHDEMVAGALTREKFAEREAMLGWQWTPHSIVLNPRYQLNVASAVMFDWAHTYVSDGLASSELGLCMAALKLSKNGYAEIGEYVRTFQFPVCRGSMTQLFSEAACRNNARKRDFTSSASEFLTLAPLFLRYFACVMLQRVRNTGNDASERVVLSFLAVLRVVALLQAVKVGVVNHTLLFDAISTHLQLFKAAHGVENMRPKHHYALHLPDMLRRFGFLLATFTHERKHRVVKRYTRDRCNLTNWDLGAMEDVTCHQLWENSLPFFRANTMAHPRGIQLDGLRELFPNMPDSAFTLHSDIACNGGSCRSGDVISCQVGEHYFLGELLTAVGVSADDSKCLYIVVSIWERSPSRSSVSEDIRYNDWATYHVKQDRVVKVPADHLDSVFTHRMSDDRSSCSVCIPYERMGLL